MALQWQAIELVSQLSPAPPNVGIWIRTDRAPVSGGWLVRTVLVKRDVAQVNPAASANLEIDTSVALTFVPDPAFAWKP
jgi:hypothetical protein